ncbi:MAG: DUF5686 family protein [Flavobacteriaceae bacterium]
MPSTIKLTTLFIFFLSASLCAQTKVGGLVKDQEGYPIPYASIIFKGTSQGTVSDEDGRFYLESDLDLKVLQVSFVGFETRELLVKPYDANLSVVLKELTNNLEAVQVYSGKRKNKGNPAVEILRKVWENKRKNGLKVYKEYAFDKYEKIEFDLNNIDSSVIKSKLFKDMEFVFEQMDTSDISGKTYLPVFINEAIYKVYGKSKGKLYKEDLEANRNSGFESNQYIIAFVKDLYVDYDVNSPYIKLFDKAFVSPVAKTGLLTYNYVLSDSAYIDNKWCYNIVYYPRRKGELTFKGDFWVTDTTYTVKEIEMSVSKSANINWVKDLYLSQSFEALNDSVIVLKRDHITSDFALRKKESSKGVYGKRTTLYGNYDFQTSRPDKFYRKVADNYNTEIYNKDDVYWNLNRLEALNEQESGVYQMLDTLSKVKRFKRMYGLASIAASDYIEFNGFDYGPLSASLGRNDVEGIRLRAGARTYFGPNDPWRIQGYTAWGTKDQNFKYAVSGKWLVNKVNRVTVSAGYINDVQQIGTSLTTTNEVLGTNVLSSAFFSVGDSGKLTQIEMTTANVRFEPIKNLQFRLGGSFKDLISASPTFNLDYLDENGEVQSRTRQSEWDAGIQWTPKRKTIGNGVELMDVDDNDYATLFLNFARGYKGVNRSDFDYRKLQFYYRQPFNIGGLGRLFTTVETGKIFGTVPLALLDVVPGNQSFVIVDNTFGLVDYYEFVTDSYVSFKFEHNFNGRILNTIPLVKRLQWREVIGLKAIYGTISEENIAINQSNVVYQAPDEVYYEYFVGIDNIFKMFRVDFMWRGNYKNVPSGRDFGVQFEVDFHF